MKKITRRGFALLLALSLLAAFGGCKKEEEQQPDESSSPSRTEVLDGPSAGIRTDGGPNTAGYWVAKLSSPGQLWMDEAAIEDYNESLTANASTRCIDLASYPESLGREELAALLEESGRPGEERYIGDQKATDAYYASLEKNMAVSSLPERSDIRYGFLTAETVLRAFPTDDPSYEFADDVEFDLFAETGLKVFEPVAVLHTSADGGWYFVQSYNYRGWLPVQSVALAADRSEWSSYLKLAQKLVVTGNRIFLNVNPYEEQISRLELTMGTVLPLLTGSQKPASVDRVSSESGYVVQLPIRTGDGGLQVRTALIPWNADVSEGYLPYTQENLLSQAFKLLGDRHGWSGTLSSRDATALTMDVFQCFGIYLPRNSSQQALVAGDTADLEGLSEEEKREEILRAPAGSLLMMDGYVGIYLGEEGGEPYALHSLFVAYDSSGQEKIINAAVVTDLNLYTDSGESYLSQMKQVKTIC